MISNKDYENELADKLIGQIPFAQALVNLDYNKEYTDSILGLKQDTSNLINNIHTKWRRVGKYYDIDTNQKFANAIIDVLKLHDSLYDLLTLERKEDNKYNG